MTGGRRSPLPRGARAPRPVHRGMTRSSRTRSTSPSARRVSAAAPSVAATTVWPSATSDLGAASPGQTFRLVNDANSPFGDIAAPPEEDEAPLHDLMQLTVT